MNKPKISIIVAGIRNYNWEKVYQSILQSTSDTFEVIFVGPTDVPNSLRQMPNIKYIRDFGSPTRCLQIGVMLCEGEILACSADDATLSKNIFDDIMQSFEMMKEKYGDTNKNVIVTRYTEGSSEGMEEENYWKMGNSYPKCTFINDDWWIFNSSIFYRSYFENLGGWDCCFECTTAAHGDLGIRTYKDNANVYMLNKSFAHCDHMPNDTGDHGPVHYAQILHDMPLFSKIHNDPNMVDRTCIPLDNWKKVPSVWARRFNISY